MACCCACCPAGAEWHRRLAELPKATWFNTVKFPQATFQSTAIKSLGGGKFEAAGKLAIKGNVRDAIVPVSLAQTTCKSNSSWHWLA